MSRWLYRVAKNNTTREKKSAAATTQHTNTGKQPQDTRARRAAIMCDTLEKKNINKSRYTEYAVKPESTCESLAQIGQQKKKTNAYNGNFICHNMGVLCECDEKGVSVDGGRKNDRGKVENKQGNITHSHNPPATITKTIESESTGRQMLEQKWWGNDMRRKQRHLCLLQMCCCHFFVLRKFILSLAFFVLCVNQWADSTHTHTLTQSTIDGRVRVSSNISR